ncbi:rho GTPase-activating protein 45-like isoform X2 [Stegostoma tigrinum]|uniref:rho GTPase-activating protein 45-like isoform X2 n=1 Tax=Stegostoma tigrinum TaxID=3053191 RepID=UPI00202ADD62|nr:rho GTPase-activating protein 45-like isoform X2 [Stegostoma tigrinum]
MLSKRSTGKSSYSPYTIALRGKKTKSKTGLDVLPNRPKELPRKDAIEIPALQTGSLSELSAGNVSMTKLSSSPSAVNTLKRPTTLSRHSSAAGFSVATSGTWGYNKGYKASPISGANAESYEGPEVEEITQLLFDVARFAESVEKLKDIVLEDKTETRRPTAHEYLGEMLRILRQVINKYPLLNTVEILTAAGTLISKVKGFHYESNNENDKKEFEKAIETIAVAFSSNVSEFLMGEVDSSTLLSLPPTDKCRSMENLCGGIAVQGDMVQAKDEFSDSGSLSAEEVDIILQRSEGGVEAALQYAKTVSKYMKDLITYLEKRTALEMDFAKGLTKLIHTCKNTITQEYHVPFLSIYSLALEQDLDFGQSMIQGVNILQNQTFLQPLAGRRLDHEKRRKEIKEQWHRAQRKLQEAEANLKKAKQAYMQRSEEHEKAMYLTVKAEEDQQSASSSNASKTLDKKRRTEEDARNKADEAEATYRTCIADAKTQKQELEDVKVNVLRQIQEIIKQSDQTLKSATISYYQRMHMQTAPLPVHFQTLCESSKLYDPGQQYASYVKDLQMEAETETHYDFESYLSQITWSPHVRPRKGSFNASEFAAHTANEMQSQSSVDEPGSPEGGSTQKEARGGGPTERRGVRSHQVHKSWPTTMSDADSVGGGVGLDSPSSATGDFSRKLPRIPSSGAISTTEDIDDKDGSTNFEQSINGMAPEIAVSTGPFKNVRLSKAAQTHRLRKLRTPSKCRECDSYVYFQGAECEECNLACHKKCLETLAIKCGHKKLQRKLQLFGRDFAQVSRDSLDGIPFIIKACISEIEKRALNMKGIYRVNGVKTRVEKLCQAFENGKELVELSQASPHDISNVLKLYLRQLPEPIMLFRLYNDLMGLAKESLQSTGDAGSKESTIEKDLLLLVARLKELLKDLPPANKATLQYIIRHLRKISELEQSNKMSPSNLGIVFGPTLMRPRPTEATVSLSSLVDYPHQARIVETLIIYYSDIFELKAEFNVPSDEDIVDEASPTDSYSERESSARRVGSGSDLPYLDESAEFDRERLYSDTLCGNSLGSEKSSESRERSLDSDSELEDGAHECTTGQTGSEEGIRRSRKGCLPKQESVASADEPPFYNDNADEECNRLAKQTENSQAQGSDADVSQTDGLASEITVECSTASSQQLEKGGQANTGDEEMDRAKNSNKSLADFNTNQSNNVDKSHWLHVHISRPSHMRERRSQLPWVRMRHGKIDIGLETRDPEFV